MSEAPKCSFCEKPEGEVQTLISSPTAKICNECVEMCVSMLDAKAASGEPDDEGGPG